jgi:hypothetical protein
MVSLAGKAYTIFPEDVQVQVEVGGEFVSASRGACMAALKVEQNPLLEEAGMKREIIHCLQRLRRKANLGWDEQVRAYIEATPRLQRVVDQHRDEILAQARSVSLEVCAQQDLPEAHRLPLKTGGETAMAAIVLAVAP